MSLPPMMLTFCLRKRKKKTVFASFCSVKEREKSTKVFYAAEKIAVTYGSERK